MDAALMRPLPIGTMLKCYAHVDREKKNLKWLGLVVKVGDAHRIRWTELGTKGSFYLDMIDPDAEHNSNIVVLFSPPVG
jgi:hypothetical protein